MIIHRSDAGRRSMFAVVPAIAAALVLAACGSGESAGSDTARGAGGAEAGAFPVTITHTFGTTKLTEAPKRVVSVGLTDQDSLIAMGIVPVAVTEWFGDAPGFVFPWAKDAFGAAGGTEKDLPEVLDATNGIPIEKVAALRPDLIIGTYAGITKKEYELLSKIAPTVAQDGDYANYGTPWDEAAMTIGTAVGQPKAMAKLIDDVKDQIDDAAADHPEFEGKTAAVVTPYEGLFIYGPEDPRSRMLVDLGFDFAEGVFGTKEEEFGESLSAERTSDLDQVDLTVWLDLSADKAVQGVFDKTKSAADGRWLNIGEGDGDYYVGHSFVTPLSIPYVLERYVPQLAAAVDGDPSTKVPAADS